MGSQPKKLSASRISAAMGINPYKSRVDLWFEIMEEEFPGWLKENGYKLPEKKEPGAPLKLGLAFENPIMDYIGLHGEREKFFESGIHTAHIDSFDTESSFIREIKTTSIFSFSEKFGEENTDQIPPEYIVQVNQQMWLSKKDFCDVWVLVFPDSQDNLEKNGILELGYSDKKQIVESLHSMGFLKHYLVSVNGNIVSEIQKTGSEFWKYIVTKTPPKPINIDDVKKILLPVSGECLATPEMVEKAKVYNYINSEFNRIKGEKEKIAGEILNYMRLNCNEAKTGKMIMKNNRGFNVASFGSRLSVNKEKAKE